jgi:hypothetical protein
MLGRDPETYVSEYQESFQRNYGTPGYINYNAIETRLLATPSSPCPLVIFKETQSISSADVSDLVGKPAARPALPTTSFADLLESL